MTDSVAMSRVLPAKELLRKESMYPAHTDFERYQNELAVKKAKEILELEEAVEFLKEKMRAIVRRLKCWTMGKDKKD